MRASPQRTTTPSHHAQFGSSFHFDSAAHVVRHRSSTPLPYFPWPSGQGDPPYVLAVMERKYSSIYICSTSDRKVLTYDISTDDFARVPASIHSNYTRVLRSPSHSDPNSPSRFLSRFNTPSPVPQTPPVTHPVSIRPTMPVPGPTSATGKRQRSGTTTPPSQQSRHIDKVPRKG